MRTVTAVAAFLCAIMAFFPARAAEEEGKGMKTAVFAGGCFWCMEHSFDKLDGVGEVVSGYSGGRVPDPTYEQVSSGTTGHREAIRVTYDPQKTGFAALLDVYWRNIDPMDAAGQFCDKGEQYKSAIFVATPEEKVLAEESVREVSKRFGLPVATDVLPAAPFYPAEEYHQKYYLKNPMSYALYRKGCGRDERLKGIWGAEGGGSHDGGR